MTGMDARLQAIRNATRVASEDLRARALSIDADPDAMEAHLDSPVFALMREVGTPDAYRESHSASGELLKHGASCLENAVGTVELARGDAAVALACPSPALAGVIVDLLGTEKQQELFYTRLHGGRTWTFFAMTEPRHGSDATAMETRLERDGAGDWLLSGRKLYIGNGARGGIGVVFGRTGPSPLSIRAALIELPAAGWQGKRVDTIGLRGAYLSELSFDKVPVRSDMLLGQHLPATRRGMWGAIKTFNAMRVQVAGAAVGTALAMTEYVAEHHKNATGADLVLARAQAARELVFEAAARTDRDPERSYLLCVAKLGAARVAVQTARWASSALGPAGLLEHPLLEKWIRDSCGFEFMEGTGNIQRLHVSRGYQAGDASV